MSVIYNAIFLANADGSGTEYANTGSGGGGSKTQGQIVLSKDTVALDYGNLSEAVTMVTNSDGVMSIFSSNPNVASVTYANGEITITSENSIGSCTITITILETANYTSVSETISVTNGAVFKTFATATDAEIKQMVLAADDGKIDLYDDCGWRVGQEHIIALDTIEQTGTYDGVSWEVGESHAAQYATLVLMHKGLYRLVDPVKNKNGSHRSTCSFVAGLKNCMIEPGYMNSTNSYATWESSARRAWCNGGFRSAMPSDLRDICKQFYTITGTRKDNKVEGSVNQTTYDYFALVGEKEAYGSRSYSTETEANALTQFTWYETASNKTKTLGDSGEEPDWWQRSPYYYDSKKCCYYPEGGSMPVFMGFASYTLGLSPFCCL